MLIDGKEIDVDALLEDTEPHKGYYNGTPIDEYQEERLRDMEQEPVKPTEEDYAGSEARETVLNYHENDPDILYRFHNDQQLEDKEQSNIMYRLMNLRPHKSYIDFSWDDLGTATLFEEIYKEEVCYCPQKGDWYIWDKRWVRQSDAGAVTEKLQTLLHLLRLYVSEITEESKDDETALKKIEEYGKYVSSIRKNTAMKNILEVVKGNMRIALADFDTNPNLLNTPRGTINLLTGERHDWQQSDNLTMITSARPLMGADKSCDRWYSFIDEIMSGDKEKAHYLQKALGYSLLGDGREECMFIAYGPRGRNGKGTLFRAIETSIGKDYIGNISSSFICESKTGKIPNLNAPQPDLVKVVGKRLVIMSEVNKDLYLSSANVKSITGRDTFTTRDLYESSFDFVPQFTLWLNINHLPGVTDDLIFTTNRIRVIPFDECFVDEDKIDKALKTKFLIPDNQPTILKWLIDGCNYYLQEGLEPSPAVKEATENYRKIHDRIGRFIEDYYIEDYREKINRAEVHTTYERWCKQAGNRYTPLGTTNFYSELADRGFPSKRFTDTIYLCGLKPKLGTTTDEVEL